MNVIHQRCEETSRRANRLDDRHAGRGRPFGDVTGVSAGRPGAASHADPNRAGAVGTGGCRVEVREKGPFGSPP
jgi:hypothetical protein